MTQTALTDLWTEAEEHMQAAAHYARRTVEEAWLAGDVLARIRAELPHGAWTPALRSRGIAPRTARRFIELRQKYPQIGQIGRFDSVSAALTDSQREETPPPPSMIYVISADDFWDWEWNQLSPLAQKHLTESEQQVVEDAILDALWEFQRDFTERPEFEAVWSAFRAALACFVDVGPLEGNEAAIKETERRFAAFVNNSIGGER